MTATVEAMQVGDAYAEPRSKDHASRGRLCSPRHPALTVEPCESRCCTLQGVVGAHIPISEKRKAKSEKQTADGRQKRNVMYQSESKNDPTPTEG